MWETQCHKPIILGWSIPYTNDDDLGIVYGDDGHGLLLWVSPRECWVSIPFFGIIAILNTLLWLFYHMTFTALIVPN
jgi:hypothetical protein